MGANGMAFLIRQSPPTITSTERSNDTKQKLTGLQVAKKTVPSSRKDLAIRQAEKLIQMDISNHTSATPTALEFSYITIQAVAAAIGSIPRIRATMKIEMIPPPEFVKFGGRFFQDLDLVASNEEEIYKFVLNPFKGEERTRLRQFIDRALGVSISDDELQGLWRSVDADIYFPTAQDLRMMLKGARDRL